MPRRSRPAEELAIVLGHGGDKDHDRARPPAGAQAISRSGKKANRSFVVLIARKAKGAGGGPSFFEGGHHSPLPGGRIHPFHPPANLPATVRLNDLRIVPSRRSPGAISRSVLGSVQLWS